MDIQPLHRYLKFSGWRALTAGPQGVRPLEDLQRVGDSFRLSKFIFWGTLATTQPPILAGKFEKKGGTLPLRDHSPSTTIDAYDDANVGDADEDDASTERCDEFGASDLEDVNNPAVEDEIPRQLNTGNVNDDGNPYFNLWSKMYQNGNMWATNPNGSISVTVGDMFIDKDQWSNHNSLASFHWVANTLLTDFKANPTMGLKVMQEIVMERHGLDIPIHTRQRAKKKEWLRYSQKVRREYVMCTTIEILAKIIQVQNCTCSSGQLVMLTQSMSTNRLCNPLRRNQKRLMNDYWMNYLNTRLESFNGKIEKSRISKDWKGKVVPRVKMLLVKAEKQSRAFRLTPTGREIFEVLKGPTHFTVDLNTHHCDCMEPKKGWCALDIKGQRYAKLQREKRKKEGWKA
ncbi:hypothetical protein Cgig2_016075 [Carnegiea gigantea]|uniref:Uncharacterized protein n=1 Tax=Carnegiea gigantea TaxID=171969 RepID=A0A9Q1GLZ9_9CARY|nr:hypothetical protein Cgig2_016075 [Carnegiea gigantea]